MTTWRRSGVGPRSSPCSPSPPFSRGRGSVVAGAPFSSQAWSSPSSSCSCRSRSMRSGPTRTSLPRGCRSSGRRWSRTPFARVRGSTASSIRTRPVPSDSRTSARSTRSTSSGTCGTSGRSSRRTCSIGSRGRSCRSCSGATRCSTHCRLRVVLSASDLADVPGLRLLGADGDTRIYENTNAYPRAWVVHHVQVVGGEDEAFAFLRARRGKRKAHS